MGEVVDIMFQNYFKPYLNLILLQNHSADSGALQLNVSLAGVPGSWWEILPELIFGIVLAFSWCYSIRWEKGSIILKILRLSFICMIVIYGSAVLGVAEVSLNSSWLVNNSYVVFCKLFVLILTLPLLYRTNILTQQALYLSAVVLFGLNLISSVDIIIFYISLEGLSLLTYGLIATRKSAGAAEAGLKYFINGAIASVLLIFGLSLMYMQSQSVMWTDIYWTGALGGNIYDEKQFIAVLLVLSALLYKLSAFPFHLALPDVYEGSDWLTVAIINFGVKASVAFMFFRLWGFFMTYNFMVQTSWVIAGVAGVSIVVGCFGALIQTSVRRFLAYTSINQGGFLLIGLITGSLAGLQAALLYTTVYLISLLLFIIAILESKLPSDNILDIRKMPPMYRIGLVLSLFSMAGVPPMFGFVSKYVVWLAMFDTALSSVNIVTQWVIGFTLAVSILTSLVSAFYYIKLIRLVSFDINFENGNGISLFNECTIFITGATLILW
jgi:NADH-quinone oxidoreductase subunit N